MPGTAVTSRPCSGSGTDLQQIDFFCCHINHPRVEFCQSFPRVFLNYSKSPPKICVIVTKTKHLCVCLEHSGRLAWNFGRASKMNTGFFPTRLGNTKQYFGAAVSLKTAALFLSTYFEHFRRYGGRPPPYHNDQALTMAVCPA